MLSDAKSPRRFKFHSPFLDRFRGGVAKVIGRGLLLLVPLLLVRSCFVTYVPPDQLGVRQVSFGSGKGLQKEPVFPGYRREIAGYERITTFPRDIQVVEFTNNSQERGDSSHLTLPAIKVPTVDGYPVDVDVTVLYRVADPQRVASQFGLSENYRQALLRVVDPLVKEYLGQLLAEQFYKPSRLQRVRELRASTAAKFRGQGFQLADLLVRQYDYPETFQTLTEQKKLQDQAVLANREIAKQSEVQTRLNQTRGEGQNLISVKTAEIEAQITEIRAKRDLYERQKRAEADLLVRTAEADGTQAINRALEGAGSSKLLRLRRGLALLEAIEGPIYITEDPTDLGRLVDGGKN